MKLDELLSKPLPFKVTELTKSFYSAEFTAGDRVIRFHAQNENGEYGGDEEDDEWIIEFGEVQADGAVSHGKTGSGNEFSVFATLKAILDDFIEKCHARMITFSAESDKKNNRGRVYAKLFKKNLPDGWQFQEEPPTDHMPAYFMMVKEALDKPLPYKVTLSSGKYWVAEFKIDNRLIQFEAEKIGGGWDIIFGEIERRPHGALGGSMKTKKTGMGGEFQIFATVKAILDQFIEEKKPIMLSLDSHKGEPSRAKLYQRMIAKNLPDGWKMERDESHPTYTTFVLKKTTI